MRPTSASRRCSRAATEVDLLLDTNVFLWWEASSSRLNNRAARLLADEGNRVFVSVASIWEITIKRRVRKLAFEGSVTDALIASGFLDIPVLGADAEMAGNLEWDHNDPFDRLIVSQAINRGLTLVTADSEIRRYAGVAVLSAG